MTEGMFSRLRHRLSWFSVRGIAAPSRGLAPSVVGVITGVSVEFTGDRDIEQDHGEQ
jgi:hypothetical protein